MNFSKGCFFLILVGCVLHSNVFAMSYFTETLSDDPLAANLYHISMTSSTSGVGLLRSDKLIIVEFSICNGKIHIDSESPFPHDDSFAYIESIDSSDTSTLIKLKVMSSPNYFGCDSSKLFLLKDHEIHEIPSFWDSDIIDTSFHSSGKIRIKEIYLYEKDIQKTYVWDDGRVYSFGEFEVDFNAFADDKSLFGFSSHYDRTNFFTLDIKNGVQKQWGSIESDAYWSFYFSENEIISASNTKPTWEVYHCSTGGIDRSFSYINPTWDSVGFTSATKFMRTAFGESVIYEKGPCSVPFSFKYYVPYEYYRSPAHIIIEQGEKMVSLLELIENDPYIIGEHVSNELIGVSKDGTFYFQRVLVYNLEDTHRDPDVKVEIIAVRPNRSS